MRMILFSFFYSWKHYNTNMEYFLKTGFNLVFGPEINYRTVKSMDFLNKLGHYDDRYFCFSFIKSNCMMIDEGFFSPKQNIFEYFCHECYWQNTILELLDFFLLEIFNSERKSIFLHKKKKKNESKTEYSYFIGNNKIKVLKLTPITSLRSFMEIAWYIIDNNIFYKN